MQSEGLLHINLPQASDATEAVKVALDDTFFSSLDQDEIVGGNVNVSLQVYASAGQIYVVKVDIEGSVVVQCDRCLDPLTLPVRVSDEVRVKDGDEEEGDAWDIKYVKGPRSEYDFSWDVYEIVETSLPMQRVHGEGECNEEVTRLIMKEEPDMDGDE